MEIKKAGTQPSVKGPADWFTGSVRVDPLFAAPDPAFVQGASVTFEPGARTAWHTHPLGQALIVTAGCGWVQREGGPIEQIQPGDVVWFAPNEKHWHGASATNGMTHIAIQERLEAVAAGDRPERRMNRLAGKRAIVTGAASGIGRVGGSAPLEAFSELQTVVISQ